jgi:SAM-dependent methyltransferase
VWTNYFDEPVAAAYDDLSADMFAPEVLGPTLDVLAELAGPDGSALELAVGTGRVALPLAARGIRVHGIELSPAMLERLHAKPEAPTVTTTLGDMTSTRVEGRFDLTYLVFNTVMNVTTQDGQVDVFANAAAHLRPGGHFVVEVGVPQLQQLPPGERFHVFTRTEDYLGLDEYDVVTQQQWSHHHRFEGREGRRSSIPFRYAWPAELDLMARLAGMRLAHRWAGWDRSPFTATSPSHVSVWRWED